MEKYLVKKSQSITAGVTNFDFFDPALDLKEQINEVTGEASIRLDSRFLPYLPAGKLKYQLESRKGNKYEIELTTEDIEELFKISSARKLAFSQRLRDPDASAKNRDRWERILFGYFIMAYK